MVKAYSVDLRQRAVDAVLAGESCGVVAERFSVARSSVIKWSHRYRETGSVAPAKMGGHRPWLLAPYREWIVERLQRPPPFDTETAAG